MRYTIYMDECCEELNAAGEHESDVWIKPFIQLQVLSCRVNESFCYYDINSSHIEGATSIQLASSGFLAELETIRAVASVIPSPPGTRLLRDETCIADQTAVYLSLEIYFLEAWINEPALHDRYWTETATSLPVPRNQGHTASIATRVNMTTRTMKANKAFLRRFIEIPDEELIHLAFSSYSRLCYVLISQAKVAMALLDAAQTDALPDPSVFGSKTQSPAQLVIGEVDYIADCTLLYRQLRRVCRVSHAIRHDNGCREHFACIVKGMISTYEHRIKGRLSTRGQAVMAQYPQVMVDAGGPAEIYGGMATVLDSDASFGGALGDGGSLAMPEFVFDDAVWQSVMETFNIPA